MDSPGLPFQLFLNRIADPVGEVLGEWNDRGRPLAASSSPKAGNRANGIAHLSLDGSPPVR